MPRIKHKHLSRAQFEFLLDHMMETQPDHEITEWLQWVWAMNDGDSSIRAGSEQGYRMMQYDKAEFDWEDEECYRYTWTEEDEIW